MLPSTWLSAMEHSTLMALERYRSTLLFMSFMRELTMMITSSDPGPTCASAPVFAR